MMPLLCHDAPQRRLNLKIERRAGVPVPEKQTNQNVQRLRRRPPKMRRTRRVARRGVLRQ